MLLLSQQNLFSIIVSIVAVEWSVITHTEQQYKVEFLCILGIIEFQYFLFWLPDKHNLTLGWTFFYQDFHIYTCYVTLRFVAAEQEYKVPNL